MKERINVVSWSDELEEFDNKYGYKINRLFGEYAVLSLGAEANELSPDDINDIHSVEKELIYRQAHAIEYLRGVVASRS